VSEPKRLVAACHQPNFFPWLGYFHKMRWSDTFVFLDDVLIQKTRGSVTNRVAVAVADKPAWMTAPLDRSYSGNLPIRDVRFAPNDPWRSRFLATLKMHYARAPHFAALHASIAALIEDPEPMLGEYNIRAITALAGLLGLEARLVRSSAYGVTSTRTLRLAELVEKVGAKTYLAGAGAIASYQKDEVFLSRGIDVMAQGFAPPAYPRGSRAPIPGLSIIDALFWLGAEGTRALLDVPPGASASASEGTEQEETVV